MRSRSLHSLSRTLPSRCRRHGSFLYSLIASVVVMITGAGCGGGAGVIRGSVVMPIPSPTPCGTMQPAGPASGQTRARLGMYYFDGWSGPLSNNGFHGLVNGPYQGREPVTGWQDNSSCAVEQQLAWAHKFGIDFFVFDWYYGGTIYDPGRLDLNSALKITHALPDRHGMQYAILYVDSPPYVAGPASWTATIDDWIGYMTDPAYVRVNGKPLLIIIDMGEMHNLFGSSSSVASALNQLRTAAQAKGLPGVFIVGGFGVPVGSLGQDTQFPDLSWMQNDGYDALSTYNYPFTPPPVNGALPFSSLAAAGNWMTSQCALKCPLPYIPVVMDGWDPRPWNEKAPNGDLVWFSRTPQKVATFVSDTIAAADANPRLRVEPAPAPPMVLMEAWNELGEGGYFVPTIGEGTRYGDALAGFLGGPRFATR
jgi:hypothetical protein